MCFYVFVSSEHYADTLLCNICEGVSFGWLNRKGGAHFFVGDEIKGVGAMKRMERNQ